MPLPMVHFAVAVQLGERSGQFPSADFLLGSIAPDAIHMRPNAQPIDKQGTHLLLDENLSDHTNIQKLLATYAGSPAPYPKFTAGYAAHLLTDRLWSSMVLEPFYTRVSASLDDDARRKLYYQETDQIDYNLYYHVPWQPKVWRSLARSAAPDYLPLLSSAEINLWNERTLHWFDDPTREPQVTPQYLTDDLVAGFIEQAVHCVESQFDAWHVTPPFV